MTTTGPEDIIGNTITTGPQDTVDVVVVVVVQTVPDGACAATTAGTGTLTAYPDANSDGACECVAAITETIIAETIIDISKQSKTWKIRTMTHLRNRFINYDYPGSWI